MADKPLTPEQEMRLARAIFEPTVYDEREFHRQNALCALFATVGYALSALYVMLEDSDFGSDFADRVLGESTEMLAHSTTLNRKLRALEAADRAFKGRPGNGVQEEKSDDGRTGK